ncbi:MAG: HDOD domain-containing protein [Deltaproteobacteria bacterium]|nr:HDOD domain-containing protein [Deltaproteobacteria bacterium]
MAIPDYIDRFKILSELGRGSQGVVYLASDPRLERNVAIKTLHKHNLLHKERQERLLREAKTVSKLQHPNIISLYEAGQDHDQLFLVFEYVDGISLKEEIRKSGAYVVHKAIRLMIQILDGISNAHEQGIVHRDLSPSNILIDKNGLPRIMDFGISVFVGNNDSAEKDIAGTPFYMSPEHFSKKGLCTQSDIFSLGLIFYEMLLERPAIEADNDFTIMYKIANEKITPPSESNNTIDKELDRIVMKALERDLSSRYSTAIQMKNDLTEYLNTKNEEAGNEGSGSNGHSTLDFLLRKIRYKSDFPTFSHNIMEINKKASVSQVNVSSASELANAVLKDYSLTNKLLKLVNSAFYGQFAGKITTVSRAVVVLGFEQVSMAASSLMLFDQLKNKNQKEVLRESAVSSFMSGIIAKDLARNIGFEAGEEAFICSMLHKLGKHLVLFYFEEEHNQIANLMAQKGISEDVAARSVLGMTYDELGSGIANAWKFPKKIVNSMRSLPRGNVDYAKTEEEKLRNLSGFSNELCSIINNPDEEASRGALEKLLKRFEKSIPLTKKQIGSLLESAKDKVDEYSEIFNVNLKKSKFIRQVENFSKTQRIEISQIERPEERTGHPDETESGYFDDVSLSESFNDTGEVKDPQSILINGIQDITNTLLEDFNLNDVLAMILETMYRGFSFNRVLFCILNSREMEMRGSLGLGKDINQVVKDFKFKIDKSPDVFNFAVIQAKDIGVIDSGDVRFQKRIPAWYVNRIFAPAFVLYPLLVNKKVVGLFYADREQSGTVLSGNQVNYMKTLCNQAVLAIKQSR